MAKFLYYGLALSGTQLFLPELARGRDFASAEPQAFTFPRLFKTRPVAEIAKAVWEKRNPNEWLEVVPLILTTPLEHKP